MKDMTNRHEQMVRLCGSRSNNMTNCAPFKDEFIDINSLSVDIDEPIFRVFSENRLFDLLKNKVNTLVKPKKWDDPMENFLLQCKLRFKDKSVVSMSELREKFYGQCWSYKEECDGLWRTYKSTANAIKVRSTPRKVMDYLYDISSRGHANKYYCGKVDYLPEDELIDFVKKNGRNFISGGDNTAIIYSILLKRQAFSYEEEIRFVFYDIEFENGGSDIYNYSVDPNVLFDEIVIDPFVDAIQFSRIESSIRGYGYSGPVTQSTLYRPKGMIIDV